MIRRFKILGFSALAMLALTACAPSVDWPWADASARPQVATPRVEPPGARPTAPLVQRHVRAPDLKAIRPAPRPTESKEGAEPALLKLVGLSEDETADLLGRPAEESAEPPGKIWTYKAAGCRLSVHLFPDMEKGGFYALDYTTAEGAAEGAKEGAKEACLGKVAGEARRKGSTVISPPSPSAVEG